jgi:hypothetical protein
LFDIITSRDFLEKLEADFEDFRKEPHSARLALNCVITAFHLYEWAWGDWLKTDYATWKILGIRDDKSFLAWIDNACVWFRAIQDLTNGTKHFATPSFRTEFVVSPPYVYDKPATEWDEGYPKPYVIDGGKGHLLIDNGPGTGPHRWKTAAALIDAVVRFWREFFARYHPDPDVRAGIREWRLQ